MTYAEGDHLGWVCRLASGGRQTESRWNVTARAGAIVWAFKQRRRTTASADQIANPANDGFKRFDTATVTIRGIELAEKIKGKISSISKG